MNKFIPVTGGLSLVALCLGGPATGQVLFSSDLDTAAGLTVIGTADTASTFGYDYSADGIPSAPNGTGTTGLKLEANLSTAAAHEIAAVTDLSITAAQYTVTVDAWVNANGPFPGGGAGSTEFAGIGAGHDGVAAGRNGASFIYSGEGGSSRDYRLYSDTTEVVADPDNNFDEPYLSAFPGQAAPAIQAQTGTVNDGVGGFQWMTVTATVNSVAGTVDYSITSDASGNSVNVGTLVSSVDGPFATTGSASIVYADLFSSVSDNAALSFGVFDNFSVVEIPEPSTLALLGLGGLAMLRRRSA